MTTKEVDPKVDPKTDPKVDPKIDPKVDPEVDPKIDPKDDPKLEPKVDPKLEPDDAKERSELGRKVKAQGEQITDMNAKIDQLITLATPVNEPEDNLDPDWVPTTRQEMDDYIEKKLFTRDTTMKQAEKKYNDAYLQTIGAFKDHEDYDDICAELGANFNVRHSDDGKLDGKMNFIEAENAHYRKKIHGKTNPLDKNKGDNKNLGTGGDDEIVDKDDVVMPKLDKDAMAYIEATGKTAEEVIAIMKKPLPLGIGSIA